MKSTALLEYSQKFLYYKKKREKRQHIEIRSQTPHARKLHSDATALGSVEPLSHNSPSEKKKESYEAISAYLKMFICPFEAVIQVFKLRRKKIDRKYKEKSMLVEEKLP